MEKNKTYEFLGKKYIEISYKDYIKLSRGGKRKLLAFSDFGMLNGKIGKYSRYKKYLMEKDKLDDKKFLLSENFERELDVWDLCSGENSDLIKIIRKYWR